MNPIHFTPNTPQVLSLKDTAGVIDGFNVAYETSDGRLLLLPYPAAIKLNQLDPQPGEAREHLATAISHLRSQLEAVQKEISKLESLRAEEATIRYDLEALLKAESAMQENAREVVAK